MCNYWTTRENTRLNIMYIPASSDAAPGPPDDLVGEYDFEADLVRLRWESPQDYGGSKINSYLVERYVS